MCTVGILRGRSAVSIFSRAPRSSLEYLYAHMSLFKDVTLEGLLLPPCFLLAFLNVPFPFSFPGVLVFSSAGIAEII